jgi:hypothetical protein
MFDPLPKQKLMIDSIEYSFVEHPSVPDLSISYAMEGRVGIVYQIVDINRNKYALKIYKTKYRSDSTYRRAKILAKYASLLGLKPALKRLFQGKQTRN